MTSITLQLSNNQSVHCLVQGTGEPLVLIHGVGMQAAAWYPQFEYFAKSHQVIALDMPGHGKSTPLSKGAMLSDFVDWAVLALQALGCELGFRSVNLAGHSMGSLIAAGVAITRADLVRRVALLNGVFMRSMEARRTVIERAACLSSGQVDSAVPLSRWFGDAPHEQACAKQVKAWLDDVNLSGYAAAYTAFAHGDDVYAKRFHEIGCPALFLTGDGDLNSTAAMSEQMAKLAKHGSAVIIKGERHMVNLTAPEQVNQAMQVWLNTPLTK
ncbi:alpha/beta hydrolase [Moraxella caviae]|uniref:Alpha/beta hydrolase n=1 Tax=Moraxella caviae TaxID=34060 RepID=A0A1T0A1P2_9GAMM|nr:alpha/beta hydrolase [Moraxella caviae]OOR89624.1 alpha/beta hydrolase [Moraxella caviae]STZ10312.1 Dihydrolipoyllysine-residue acetyltransferase component of acetoin cleaving system [Moraxella caviae]VEW12646.1 Dihydrolipoyllysine-residue acetyltransferase component of acetoin cleaving system [Moraxella caviae]